MRRPTPMPEEPNFQAGEFFLFGCHDQKKPLQATFAESEYDDSRSPTEGIARIGILTVTPRAKKEMDDFVECLDIGDERLYPDFAHHSEMLREKYEKEK